MTVSENPRASERFRKTPWKFQQTFRTPLKDLKPFVATIASGCEPFQGGCVTIDEVVFEPKNLNAFLSNTHCRHSTAMIGLSQPLVSRKLSHFFGQC